MFKHYIQIPHERTLCKIHLCNKFVCVIKDVVIVHRGMIDNGLLRYRDRKRSRPLVEQHPVGPRREQHLVGIMWIEMHQ